MSIIIENSNLSLKLSDRCKVESLYSKKTGEEFIKSPCDLPFFSVTEDRPYNNEIKLTYMNKETTFSANRVRREGDKLIVGFELVKFEAVVELSIKDDYVAFTLVDFLAQAKDFPGPMNFPPVSKFRLVQLPLDRSLPYGLWLNVCHGDSSVVGVISASPHGFSGCEYYGDRRVLKTDAVRGIKLRGCTSVLILTPKDEFLSAVESVENDYDLPRGVESRRNPLINASIYWTRDICPENLEEHIKYLKMGGYKLMLIYFESIFKNDTGYYAYCGDYDYKDSYPNGADSLKAMLDRLHKEGITVGFHYLHTHVGIKSRYVTPRADYRLHIRDKFTLARDITETDTVIYVEECPADAALVDGTRVLRFDTELISYEGYSEEYPYHFYGCKRGHFDTEIYPHKRASVGGILDLSEFTATSVYLDQNTDLQDEIGEKIAAAYNLGFEFVYFDGSEGVQAPFEYHVPNAQYRSYKSLAKPPIFCEGAAKAHFSWHMLSGANAFDKFKTPIFKEMIIEHPFKEAALMQLDFTRVNFGWWGFWQDTRPDIYEFGTSKAAAYDCPATTMAVLGEYRKHPRISDIFEVMRRWEDVRARKWLTEEQKLLLRQADKEFTLLLNKNGEYELCEYEQTQVADGKSSITAFILSRGEYNYITLWDNEGESVLKIDASAVVSYTDEIDFGEREVSYEGKKAILKVNRKAYMKSTLSLDGLREALRNAEVTK